jgi:hypothetical protein
MKKQKMITQMKKLFLFFTGAVFSITVFSQNGWRDIAVIDGLEVYVDTLSIERKGNVLYAQIKTVYTSDSTKNTYVDKIRHAYGSDKKVEKKLEKWADFNYNISIRVFDCSNKRYKIIEIVDYTSTGKKIVKTKTPEKNRRWLPVGIDTMGDYTLYYICDFSYD